MGYDPNAEKRGALWESRFIANAGFRAADLLHLLEQSGEPTILGIHWMSPKNFLRHFS